MKRKSFLKLLATTAAAPLAHGAASGPTTTGKAPPPPAPPSLPPDAWTLVVLPDTQYYSLSFPEVFHKQTAWIVANQERYRIRFVAHVGDIVHNNSHPEWLNARAAMNTLLEAKIPFSVLPGNHDLGRWGRVDDRSTHLNDYFTYWDYRIGEASGFFERGHLENSWHRLSTATGNYLILSLEFGPRNAVLEWAGRMAGENADREVIVVTHAYLNRDSTRYDWAAKGQGQRWNPKSYPFAADGGDVNDAEEMWTKFVSRHANIRFVLSGHVLDNGTGYLVSQGQAGNRVHQLLANYQTGVQPDHGFGGGGYLRLMHFQPDRQTVEVRTYSPWFEKFLTAPDQQFSVTL